jgi:hypothetical protein
MLLLLLLQLTRFVSTPCRSDGSAAGWHELPRCSASLLLLCMLPLADSV